MHNASALAGQGACVQSTYLGPTFSHPRFRGLGPEENIVTRSLNRTEGVLPLHSTRSCSVDSEAVSVVDGARLQFSSPVGEVNLTCWDFGGMPETWPLTFQWASAPAPSSENPETSVDESQGEARDEAAFTLGLWTATTIVCFVLATAFFLHSRRSTASSKPADRSEDTSDFLLSLNSASPSREEKFSDGATSTKPTGHPLRMIFNAQTQRRTLNERCSEDLPAVSSRLIASTPVQPSRLMQILLQPRRVLGRFQTQTPCNRPAPAHPLNSAPPSGAYLHQRRCVQCLRFA